MDSNDLKEVKKYALKLLGHRDRSEREIRQRLELKGYSEPLIKETVEYLKEKALIDDSELAKALMRYCREVKYLGLYGCKHFLHDRGIPEDIIKEIFFNREDEFETAMRLTGKKLSTFKAYGADKGKKRLMGLLRRRGFDSGTITCVLKEVL